MSVYLLCLVQFYSSRNIIPNSQLCYQGKTDHVPSKQPEAHTHTNHVNQIKSGTHIYIYSYDIVPVHIPRYSSCTATVSVYAPLHIHCISACVVPRLKIPQMSQLTVTIIHYIASLAIRHGLTY